MGRHLILLLPLLLMRCTGDITTQEDSGRRRDRGSSPRDGKGGSEGSPADSEGESCTQGTYLNGYCYFTAGLDQMDYATAKQLCNAVAGGQPASIHSEDENKLIFGMLLAIRSAIWIGLVGSGGSFQWEDGSQLSYTNWDSGEPDGDDCVLMVGPYEDQSRHGKWQDTRCSRLYREIACKYKP
jgi:hypothetical protein